MIRETIEQWEREHLSQYACKSTESKGRKREEPSCDVRTEFQRDRDRILHSKSFRRLMYKTQVFINPEGDHYRTRLTHTLEVSQIARTIARGLGLNEDLTEAIALGHDLGHTPFGHAGEKALNQLCPYGFKHNEQSVRLTERIEKKGNGLNLTHEVLDGILNHRSSGNPSTMEGKVVRLSDKIAYLNHDIDDAIRGGVMKMQDIPPFILKLFGETTKSRLNCMVTDTIQNSLNQDDILMSDEVFFGLTELRKFMFQHIYRDSRAKEDDKKISFMITEMYQYYMEHENEMEEEFVNLIKKESEPIEKVVCDAIACMTDRYVLKMFNKIFIPNSYHID